MDTPRPLSDDELDAAIASASRIYDRLIQERRRRENAKREEAERQRSGAAFMRMAERRGIGFARVGMTVEVDGEQGVIVGHNDSCNLNVLMLSGPRKGAISNCHPGWKIRYFDDSGEPIDVNRAGRSPSQLCRRPGPRS